MMKTKVIRLVLGFLPAFAAWQLQAQSDEQMARVFEWKFLMDAPDAGFVPMPEMGGWEEPATQSKVVCMATPVSYTRMIEDLEALQSEEGQRVLEKRVLDLNGVNGLLMLLEFAPVAGEDTEMTYTLMFVRPFEEYVLVLNAQYPKTEHERLYTKMLATFASVRKKDP